MSTPNGPDQKIVITAATGRLGRLVVAELLNQGLPAGNIAAAVRSPQTAASLAELGVEIRHADYTEPQTLGPAFAGADRLLLIPSAEYGQRFPQMKNAIDAAVKANVSQIAYTSFVNTPVSTLRLADEHKQAEAYVVRSGLPFTFLRNGGYTELYTGELGDIGPALDSGVMYGCAGEGRVSGATRADLAAAAARVLLGAVGSGQAHAAANNGRVYELGGTAFSLHEVAAEFSRQSGRPLRYQDLSVGEYAETLTTQGLPREFADLLADTSLAVSNGDWFTTSNDLEQLIERPAVPLADVIATQLRAF
ncbi:NAD(P)H-binding protein [Paenarthrobacter nitroguajacolicus]|uniref:NAD(P)H-binding protein n=1 Tax=Paenarthrobacter nitroguajacolicus TaxID=211146 RepID=UPI0015BCB973|nr:NAD(P)H-binding protein [Paenarthrobacter nitroguajacolicus]NWL31987.1 NAD(P)-dependent oxidoreductase [Paenarthrobacter nitroguajacolicus]